MVSDASNEPDGSLRADARQHHYEEGLRQVNEGNFEEAARSFSQYIESNPESTPNSLEFSRAYITRGYCYAQTGKYGEAIDDCKKALALGPGSEETGHCNEIIAFAKGQEIRNAHQNYEKNKSYIDCSTSRGFADGQKALEWVADKREFLSIIGGRTLSHREVALMLWAGERLVKRGLDGTPERQLSKKMLLSCCEFNDKHPQIGKESIAVWKLLAEVGRKCREYACDPITNRLNRNKARRLYSDAMSSIAKGDYGLAMAQLGQTIGIDSKSAQAYLKRGQIWARYWKYDQAIADVKRAIELDPGLRIAKDTLAAIMEKKERDEAGEDKLIDTPAAKPPAEALPKSVKAAQDEQDEGDAKPTLLTKIGRGIAIGAAYTLGALAIAGAGYGAWRGCEAVRQHYPTLGTYAIEQAEALTNYLKSQGSAFRKAKTQKITRQADQKPQAAQAKPLQDVQSRTDIMKTRANAAAAGQGNVPQNRLPRSNLKGKTR